MSGSVRESGEHARANRNPYCQAENDSRERVLTCILKAVTWPPHPLPTPFPLSGRRASLASGAGFPLFLLAPQQLPVDVGDLLQVLPGAMIILIQRRTCATRSDGTILSFRWDRSNVTLKYRTGPCGSPLAHLQFGFPQFLGGAVRRRTKGAALLVTEADDRIQIGGAIGGIESEEQAHADRDQHAESDPQH